MNMKSSSKPISSPGRPDKFPPPLMRFLRTNVASRSRGRSRSSPMFVRKRTTAIDSQEPSSPKVTCMGQVRVRRSSKHHHAAAKRNRNNGDTSPTRCSRRCWWFRDGLCCCRLAAKIRPSSCHCHCPSKPLWPNCSFLFSFRSKRTKVRQDSAISQLNLRERYNEETQHGDYELEEEGFQERADANANEDVPVPTTPPKNALLLTRCRSAPYRSSSLASRFWGSPLDNEETEEGQKTEQQNGQQTEHEKTTSQIESVSDKEGRLDPRAEEEPGFFKGLEDTVKERIIKSENARDLKRWDGGGDSARPLILTRCKSEPARTSQKLDPEINFWKKRRLGLAGSSSPHYFHCSDIWGCTRESP
ncbi:uncharacterized protein LOC114732810 [Neltuma alba]|uniref:uncharacterized protein LOC114732810 n=1 Tax=Neltuma alba TaxID=207710 RepID=UPI0010A56420|nr:uncharacterized protein LOC114732810 [Prosopis alba]